MMRRRIFLSALLVLPLSACGPSGEGEQMTPQSDNALDAKVLQIKQNGGSAALASLTTFEWDSVYCYMEGATADEVNAGVGQTVLKPGTRFTSSATLAVFVKAGKVAKVLTLPELTFTPGPQPAGVVIEQNKLRAPA